MDNVYYYFYYLLVKFQLKIFKGKGDPFFTSVMIISICFFSNIFLLISLIGLIPTLGRNQMYAFVLPILIIIVIINSYFLWMKEKYRKILIHYNKLYKNKKHSNIAIILAISYIAFSFVSSFYIAYLIRSAN